MGLDAPFPGMLKACAPRKKITSSIGMESPAKDMFGPGCKPVVGVDMSAYMIPAAKSDRGAEEFHQQPPFPAQHVARTVLQFLRKLMRAGRWLRRSARL